MVCFLVFYQLEFDTFFVVARLFIWFSCISNIILWKTLSYIGKSSSFLNSELAKILQTIYNGEGKKSVISQVCVIWTFMHKDFTCQPPYKMMKRISITIIWND